VLQRVGTEVRRVRYERDGRPIGRQRGLRRSAVRLRAAGRDARATHDACLDVDDVHVGKAVRVVCDQGRWRFEGDPRRIRVDCQRRPIVIAPDRAVEQRIGCRLREVAPIEEHPGKHRRAAIKLRRGRREHLVTAVV
jgi:hypothetical protein